MALLAASLLLVAPGLAFPAITHNTSSLAGRDLHVEWTAWGDSYATGVGAGSGGRGRRCLRYPYSYPEKIVSAGLDGVMNFPACSGATTQETLDYQFARTPSEVAGSVMYEYAAAGKPKFGTLTVGGDDIDFVGLIQNCIVGGWGDWIIGHPATQRSCADQQAFSWGLISENGNKDEPNSHLVFGIESVINKALRYGRENSGDDFRLYVTGYGEFFSTESANCDSSDWIIDRDHRPNPPLRLTQELRSDLNHMSRTLNAAVKRVVDRYSQAQQLIKYIDINSMLDGHRFCEAKYQKPEPWVDNPDLWFLHYPYDTLRPDAKVQDAIAVVQKTFADNVNAVAFDPKTTTTSNLQKQLWDKVDLKAVGDKLGTQDQSDPGWSNFWEAIGYRARLFHPKIDFHTAIANVIVNQYKSDTAAPPPQQQQQDTLTCAGVKTKKWLSREALNGVIPTFCDEAARQGGQDKDSGGIKREYLGGGEKVVLQLDWPSGGSFKPNKDECVKQMTTIMESCDGNNPGGQNPLNWKHGGYKQVDTAKYSVLPQTDRYTSGQCAAHINERTSWSGYDGPGTSRKWTFSVNVDIKDGAGNIIGGTANKAAPCDTQSYVGEGLFSSLRLKCEAQDDMYIRLDIGDNHWRSTDAFNGQPAYCQVGPWDTSMGVIQGDAGRDMDCFFPC